MAYNLMDEAWLHVEYGDGYRKWIAPWQIAEQTEHGLPTGFCSGRPDLDGAMIEFTIGLIQTFLCPRNEREWRGLWRNPPDGAALRAILTADDVKACFELLGDGHCFMQDEDLLENGKSTHVEALLIDAAGAQAVRRGSDHFVKHDRVGHVCPRCVAQALYCLQTYSPSIGFIHSGKPLSFVYDIADLVKFETVVPIAFQIAAGPTVNYDRMTRLGCRDAFRQSRLLDRLIPLIEEVLRAGGLEVPQPADDCQPVAFTESEEA